MAGHMCDSFCPWCRLRVSASHWTPSVNLSSVNLWSICFMISHMAVLIVQVKWTYQAYYCSPRMENCEILAALGDRWTSSRYPFNFVEPSRPSGARGFNIWQERIGRCEADILGNVIFTLMTTYTIAHLLAHVDQNEGMKLGGVWFE